MKRTCGRLSCGILAVLLSMGLPASGAEPAAPETGSREAIGMLTNGLDRAAVLELVGRPAGNLVRDNVEILYYGDQGTVTLVDGEVLKYQLISEEEARAIADERERKAAKLAAEEEAARRQRIDAGTAEKQRTLSDASFPDRSPSAKLAYWRDFASKYPEVSVSAELAVAEDEVGMAEKTSILAESLSVAERVARLKVFAAQYPRVPVAREIAEAQAQIDGTDPKSIAEKITALETAAKDAEIRTHWSGKWTHRKAIREYQSLTNQIEKLKVQQAQSNETGKAAAAAAEPAQ